MRLLVSRSDQDSARDADTAALVFIASGVPMYYLTARSRTRNAEFDSSSSSGWGVQATLSGELFDQYTKQWSLTTGRCVDQIPRRYRWVLAAKMAATI